MPTPSSASLTGGRQQERPDFRLGAPRAVRQLLIALLLGTGSLGHAGPVPWPDAPFSYFASNTRLADLLAEFAASFSLSLNISGDIGGVVNGKFTTRNATEFIAKLGGVYGFAWYTHAGTLFISKASEVTTLNIPVNVGNAAGLRKALNDLGVLEPRFGWGELPERGVSIVSGPRSYVDMVEQTVRSLPQATSGAQQVMVFRLRHASADDRTILYRDKEMTTPGLASILRDLISGRGGTGVGGVNNESISAIAAPLRAAPSTNGDSTGSLPSAAGGTTGAPTQMVRGADAIGSAGSSTSGMRVRAPSIQSDPRLNALIIQDVPERMPIYERLIAQLDVPTALIEIEAMIIDVNTDRAKDLGINWAGRSGGTAVGFGALTAMPAAGTLAIVKGPLSAAVTTGTLAVDGGSYLINQIRLLEGVGDARIQSKPSVLTADNTGALLDLSETFYVRVQGERVATVTPVTAGTTLRVTPRVIRTSGDNQIQLLIDIEDGQIQDRQIDTLPTVRRSSVSTQAIVQPSETLLIAGYSTDQTIESNQKVPGLGDIPGLGLLFSNRSTKVQKRERLFLIKPRIVSLPDTQVGEAGERQDPGLNLRISTFAGSAKRPTGDSQAPQPMMPTLADQPRP